MRVDRHIFSGAAVALSFVVVFVGAIWSVVRFSIGWGEFLWMQRAFDEPFYFWHLANEGFVFDYRLFGGLLGIPLLKAGASFDVMTEAYAFVMPSLVFAGTWAMAGTWESHPIKRLVWAFLLLMSFELLSGSDAVIYQDPPATTLANMLGKPALLKQDLMNFFIFCRRPEQQSSFVVLFFYLAGVFGSFLVWRPKLYQVVCVATPFLAFVYINEAIIAVMIFGMLSVVSSVVYRRPMWRPFACALVATAIIVVALALGSSTGTASDRGIFATHLPILRPSVVFSVIGLCVLAFQLRRAAYPFLSRHWAALVSLSVPLITLNQQVMTGRAILPQNWELSGNYICIVTGYAMLFSGWKDAVANRFRLLRDAGAVVLWVALLAVMARGQLLNEANYRSTNDQSVAFSKVYREAESKVGPIDLVVLPHLWDESLFVTRVPRGAKVLGGYNWILDHWPPTWSVNEAFSDYASRAAPNFDVGFETLARRGVTPAQLTASMKDEIQSDRCWPTMMYFFSLQDCWPTFSNYTSQAFKQLPSAIGPLVAMYESYRRAIPRGPSLKVLLIVAEPLKSDESGPFHNTLVASFEATVGGSVVRAYGYMQTTD
jgi:hypothetical protein